MHICIKRFCERLNTTDDIHYDAHIPYDGLCTVKPSEKILLCTKDDDQDFYTLKF